MVYGASAENPVPLDEDGPLHAVRRRGRGRRHCSRSRSSRRRPRSVHPGLRVTVVRPAVLVGPGVDSLFTRHFEAPRLLVVKDSSPHWQFCHVDDLVSALELAALGAVEGAGDRRRATATSPRTRSRRSPACAGSSCRPGIAYGTAERLHRLGMTPAPASELAFTAEPWVVPSTRLRAAGWTPSYDNREALGVTGRGAGPPGIGRARPSARSRRDARRRRCHRRRSGHRGRGPADPPAAPRRLTGWD